MYEYFFPFYCLLFVRKKAAIDSQNFIFLATSWHEGMAGFEPKTLLLLQCVTIWYTHCATVPSLICARLPSKGDIFIFYFIGEDDIYSKNDNYSKKRHLVEKTTFSCIYNL